MCLSIANWAVSMIFWMLTSYLSTWSMRALDASQAQAGLVGGAFFAGAFIARLLTGPALDRLGERRVVIGAMVAQLVCCSAYLFVEAVEALIALRLAHGICLGLLVGGMAAAALSRVPGSRRGEGSGWFTLGLALATGLGPWLGALLGRGQGDAVFHAAMGFAGIALAMALLVARSLDAAPHNPGKGLPRLGDMVDARALPIGAVAMLCGMAFGLTITFVVPFGESIGLGAAAGSYFVVYALVIMVSRPVAGLLQDRIGDLRIIAPIVLAAVAGLALTTVARSSLVLLLGAALLGLGYGTLVPAGQTVAINRVGHARAGVGLSSYFLLVDLGTGVGPLVLGGLATSIGYRGSFAAATGLTAIAFVLALVVRRRDPGPVGLQ